MQTCRITRELGIDMGHRVTEHAGKCKNLHGHRYTIQVTLEGSVASKGQQDGMVLDFGFLKDLMMDLIDKPCDHGLCLGINDPFTARMLQAAYRLTEKAVQKDGFCLTQGEYGKLYVINVTPTAENLAYHWFRRLCEPVLDKSGGRARVVGVKVWETPNCSAEYVTPHA